MFLIAISSNWPLEKDDSSTELEIRSGDDDEEHESFVFSTIFVYNRSMSA
ncbi:hypothetical protein Scep_000233 [Stephania cephalantha]|uniref:Uncharacterized protein n=1 Tax=Stephania cephalantha TaxID=152367 RepID=A0AAP0L5P0_9MAGN